MKKETKIQITNIAKPLLAMSTLMVWMWVIATIASSPVPLIEQAPYCMGSTMIIFAILTALYKGLEFWVGDES